MPQGSSDSTFLLLMVAGMVILMILPQWISRRRQKRREETLAVGDSIVTIGGLLGTITYINFEENLARIRIADGVEIRILPGAISGRREDQVPGAGKEEHSASEASSDEG